MTQTNREWLIENLPREIFDDEDAYNQCLKYLTEMDTTARLDGIKKEPLTLAMAFIWTETPQGGRYWSDLHDEWREWNGYDSLSLRTEYNKVMAMEDTLEQRGSRYGAFKDNARVTQEALAVFMREPQWESLSNTHKEFFHMTLHKMSRMICGDPNYVDNPHDIAGYAKLLEDELVSHKDSE